jgi:lipoprotein-anchoring transpeptidase ErfK/SrfK
MKGYSLVKEKIFTLFLIAIALTITSTTETEVAQVKNETTSTSEAVSSKKTDTPVVTSTLYGIVTDSCDTQYNTPCVRIRSGPGVNYPVITTIRNNAVFGLGGSVQQHDGVWYKIVFNEWLRYGERVHGEWYIRGDFITPYEENTAPIKNPTKKIITIDRSTQTMYAYENGSLVMKESVSTGIEQTPTPRGVFTVYKKTPSRYMQGPIPEISTKYYDLPGVPWNLYFTQEGAVIHGAYWHDNFGKRWSNGCVNLPPEKAKLLYEWADVGTTVIVKD